LVAFAVNRTACVSATLSLLDPEDHHAEFSSLITMLHH
jgi:hypothetical protein